MTKSIAYSDGIETTFKEFLSLTKPTVTLLVVVTVVPSVLLADTGLPSLFTLLAATLGTMCFSASAGVFNQIIESTIDQNMTRTCSRSLPLGKIHKSSAITFGLLLAGCGFLLLYGGTHPLAAFVAIAAHLFYVLGYTVILKPRTSQNIVIGGAAGAVGPLIGWAAVTGDISLSAWILAGIIFLWTPPHFWALSLKYKEDYAKANIPMYPVIYGDDRTRKMIFLYSLLLLPAVVSLYVIGTGSWFYLGTSLALTGKLVMDSYGIYASGSNQNVMKFFHFSCVYTLGIFTFLALDRLAILLIL